MVIPGLEQKNAEGTSLRQGEKKKFSCDIFTALAQKISVHA